MKGKNKKFKEFGFTLIELLAVIVILAIIALIATPIILGIVEDARKDSFMRSVELVVGTTDIDIFSKNFTDSYTYTITDGVVSDLEVGVKNTEGMNGKIKYDKNGNDTYAIYNGKYCVIKTSGMKKAEITDYVEGECVLGKATDVKYFTYKEIDVIQYKIVDKDVCVDLLVDEWGYYEDEAISTCNNEPNPYVGMTFTQYLASGEAPQEEINELKEAGAIEEINISGIEITGYSSEGPKDVIIPEEINGNEVISIGNFAFSNMSLTSVELPETLVKIGHSAFSTNLFTDITLPNSLKIIEDYAFCYTNLNQTSVNDIANINEYAYCTITDENCFTYEDAKLVEYEIVDIDACVDWFENDGYDEEDAISNCNNEPQEWWGEMTLTEWLVSGYADQEMIDGLKEAGAIEENITSLEGIEITGYSCGYTDIVIPSIIDNKEVVSIGVKSFSTYEYSGSGNTIPINYELAGSRGGILTSIAIPDSVEYVESLAFSVNQISGLKLSANLSNIGFSAFSENNLIQVSIPNSVKSIGVAAFYYNNLYNLIISDNNQLEEVGEAAFMCMNIPEDSKGYQIIYNINPEAIGSCEG